MTAYEWDICLDPHTMLRLHRADLPDFAQLATVFSMRKLRLFAVACYAHRTDWHVNPTTCEIIELSEQAADDPAFTPMRDLNALAIDNGIACGFRDAVSAALVSCERPVHASEGIMAASDIFAGLLREVMGNPFRPVRHRCLTCLAESQPGFLGVRSCPTCNPEGEVDPVWHGWRRGIDPRLRTSDVMNITTAIYRDRDFNQLPILADALTDAGYVDAPCPFCLEQQVLRLKEPLNLWPLLCNQCTGDGFLHESLVEHLSAPVSHVRGCWALDAVCGRD